MPHLGDTKRCKWNFRLYGIVFASQCLPWCDVPKMLPTWRVYCVNLNIYFGQKGIACSRVSSLILHLQITFNISWTHTDTHTEEQRQAHKPLQCFPVQKEITDAVGLVPAFQARSVCICVFSCVQCSTEAHSALRFGRGFWPRPKQKATVVSLQIACSKYQSTTEASEEDIDGYARGRALGKQMAFIKLPSAPQKWSIDWVVLTIGQDERRIISLSFIHPKEKRVSDKEEVLC